MTSDDLFPWFVLASVVTLMAWLGVAVAMPVAVDVYGGLAGLL